MATPNAAIITRRPNGQIDTIVLDATKREGHKLANAVTDHPVEQGSPISDHSRTEAERVTLDCFVSNTPLSLEQAQRISDALGLAFGDPSSGAQGQPQYADLAYARLVDLNRRPRLITVVTTLRTYTNVTIESIDINREARNVNGLEFTVGLKTVRVVSNKMTRVVVAKDKRAGDKARTGAKVPQNAPVDQSQLDKAYEVASTKTGTVDKIVGFAGGLVGTGTP